jgi:hypothetical protein
MLPCRVMFPALGRVRTMSAAAHANWARLFSCCTYVSMITRPWAPYR